MNTNYLAQLTSEPSLSSVLQQTGVAIEDNILLSLVDVWLDKVSIKFIPKETSQKIIEVFLSFLSYLNRRFDSEKNNHSDYLEA